MVFNIETNVNKDNLFYKKIIEILNEDNSVYGLVDFLKNNNIFTRETYIGEPYDGTIFKIPLKEWNDKTEMNLVIDESKYYADPVPILDDLLDSYCGTIWICTDNDNDNNKKHFVCIHGSC